MDKIHTTKWHDLPSSSIGLSWLSSPRLTGGEDSSRAAMFEVGPGASIASMMSLFWGVSTVLVSAVAGATVFDLASIPCSFSFKPGLSPSKLHSVPPDAPKPSALSPY